MVMTDLKKKGFEIYVFENQYPYFSSQFVCLVSLSILACFIFKTFYIYLGNIPAFLINEHFKVLCIPSPFSKLSQRCFTDPVFNKFDRLYLNTCLVTME